jgi:exonuclease SbcD
MRLLHMADAHFGRRFSSSRFGPEVAAARRKALEDALRLIIRYANEHDVDYILCAGDLIESSEIRPSDLRVLGEILSSLNRAKMLIVAGNHDPLDASSPYHRAPLAADLADKITLLPPLYSRSMLDEDTALHAFSFAEAIVRENPLENMPLDMSARRNLLLLHCDAISAKNDYLPARPEFLRKFDYCALGHVHQPLEILPHARYCGSLIGMDRNETGPRGFVLVDLDGGVSSRFVPLALPTYEEARVEVDERMSEPAIAQKIRETMDALPRENLYSVTLSGLHAVGARPDPKALAQQLQKAGYSIYILDKTRPAYDLAALSTEHRDDLIGQVIDAFCAEDSTGEAEKLALEYALAALMEGGQAP